MTEPAPFPVQIPWTWKDVSVRDIPTHVPWPMVALHERQALKNHSQSLNDLARRGGLSPDELVAVIERRRWFAMGAQEAVDKLNGYVREWERRNP